MATLEKAEVIEKICIVCPIGCTLKITEDPNEDEGYLVEGNQCNRGHVYAIKEMTNPTRIVTSTVKIKDMDNVMLPVKTTDGIPKGKMFELMETINEIEVDLPINKNDVILSNLFDLDVDLVATRSII